MHIERTVISVVQQIFEKDIKTNNKIKDVALFEVIEKFIINNFGSVISVSSIYEYLVKKEKLKVDRRLECDFIARKDFDKYFYIQVSKTIADEKVEEREYKPFYEIKNMYPKYLFTSDVLLQNKDGVINVNIADFIYNNKDL